MFHEPPDHFLYSAYRVDITFVDSWGNAKTTCGTSFVIEGNPKVPWIVTNRHVVDIDYNQVTSKYKDYKLREWTLTGRRLDDSLYTLKLHPDARQYPHPQQENDVVLIEPRFFWDGAAELKPKLHWHFGREHLATPNVFAHSLRPFDLVCYTGFPPQHDKAGNRPILRSGHIASDPRFNYSWDNQSHGSCIAYEGFSFPGSSGSPVFAPARGASNIPESRGGYLVGVNAGHVPSSSHSHSGISYFYTSTVILEIIAHYGLI